MKVIVSLTSIFDNLPGLRETLRSLFVQSLKPDVIVLYLSPMPYLLDKGFTDYKIPDWLENMPIEIRWVMNVGPYRKLLPVLQEMWDEDCVIITCDDDTIYHKDFVKRLVKTYKKEKCCVAYRCKYFSPDMNYDEMSKAKEKSIGNFHTGKGGVLYHPSFFYGTNIFSNKFLELCPYNDDFWFNFWRMKNGIPCIALDEPYMEVDLTHTDLALYTHYNKEKNDEQLKQSYAWIFSETK